MKTTIGKYDPDTRNVPVRFAQDGLVHDRTVNACLKEDGSYDRTATAARVEQVAAGVAAKITAGAIGIPEPEMPEVEAPAPTE